MFNACPNCGEPIKGEPVVCPNCEYMFASGPAVSVLKGLGFRVGDLIDGKYSIISLLGSGGMGDVFQVRHVYLNAIRTLKILRKGLSVDEVFRERFLREARLATRIQHPNVAIIHDFSTLADGTQYIVSEFVDGPTVRQALDREGFFEPAVAVDICRDVLMGLDTIHRAGLLHRDISPSNIIITTTETGERSAKIIDLGIAKQLRDDSEDQTREGLFVGNPRYASPEQFGSLSAGEQIDARSDLYSLGIVVYEMLTGKPPFVANTPIEYVLKHLTEPAPPLQGLTTALQRVVLHALEKNRDNRFASARDFSTAFTQLTPEDLVAVPRAKEPVPVRAAAQEKTDHSPLPSITLVTALNAPAAPSHTVIPAAEDITPPSDATLIRRLDERELEGPVQIGRFTLLEEIATGKSGRLFKAFDPVRGRVVGVKVVSGHRSIDRARMLRAARMWLDMNHEHIVKVFEVHPSTADHGPLIVTELVDGMRLDHFVAQAAPSIGQRLEIVAQICKALQYVHGLGIVHREIHPTNIMVQPKDLKAFLLDSGIARPVVDNQPALTSVGSIVGDLQFMAPEQMQGDAEQRSDLFSLGVVLYSLLLNAKPSVADLPTLHTRVASLRELPARVRQVLAKAVAPRPADRFQSAEAFEAALRDLLPREVARISRARLVVTLHGIRTHAKWQRAFVEVAQEAALFCHLDRWNFGYFSVLRFLLPWSRDARVEWLRTVYQEEFPDVAFNARESELPSIVAHSFGTYILGNALLRYPYLRFNKVILCGSILPPEFPWSTLIDRGQIQAVRNEYGAEDIWTRLVQFAVPATGPSGIQGFREEGDRIEQEQFQFKHSEYFDRAHMKSRWVPFLLRPLPYNMPIEERAS